MSVIRDFAYSRFLGFDMDIVMEKVREKGLVCFGSGADGIVAEKVFRDRVKEFVFCDNDERKWKWSTGYFTTAIVEKIPAK